MTVYVAHAPADRAAAEALEKFLERRGQFVEPDDGTTALAPVRQSDAVVLLLSKDFVFGPTRLRLEQRALDAWADQRLIVVKLDKGIAPVGLRDLPAIDASFEAQREFKWQEVASKVRETLARPPALPQEPDEPDEIEARPAQKQRGGALSAIVLLLLALPGVGAAAVATAIWLANRIGPAPGTLEDLRRGVEEFGVRYGAPAGATEWVFLAVMIVTLAIFASFLARLFAPRAKPAKRKASPPPVSAPEPEPGRSDAVFVSYARANAKDVLPVIEAAKAQGRSFWIDQKGIGAGQSWAGEVVRAIRTAGGVVVMCSKAAFESDHVKREIYLADRYRKKLTPVFIEQAEPPEDFEYFFAGVQQLKLFDTPEAERPDALMRALGAAT
ncbi:MAG TPA: toll/interleukin-1 receptor domain-containing protein [Candidatus Binatia bacterium]|nr:toll/interleukin-1 receptor domain-containing protein [Candidatus Binatia bacterium]